VVSIVLVKWLDATMEGGWLDNEYAEALDEFEPNVTSVGFVVAEDGNFLRLSQSDGTNVQGNLLTIPKAWIFSAEPIAAKFRSDDDSAEMH
jgi:hypothetical protein